MKLYDSYSQKKVEIKDKKITIYNCGPTVYNYVHIGNIRPLITMDILYRFLKASKKNVKYALNITDVDDKIINKAEAEHTTEKAISEKYTKAYFDLFKQLNVLKQDYNPKVTENIKGIIGYVEKLVKKHKGYVGANGDVYFDINSVKQIYGKLSKQNISELLHGTRKELNDDKKSPLDFVLWKKTTDGINWKSPWNTHGRPGWHTECSYFINKIFGDKGVTIHGGGIDLKFPHHENENAQNVALTGKGLARDWMHVGHINVNNEKMSKSLGNFILAKDLVEKYNGNVIRWFFLQTQYENPINFTNEVMEQAKNEWEKIIKSLNNAIIQLKLSGSSFVKSNTTKMSKEFIDAMNDDLNLPNVTSHLYSLIKSNSQLLREKNFKLVNKNINTAIKELEILGFVVKTVSATDPLLTKWKNALIKKDYQTVEAIRTSFIKKGLI